MDILFHAFSVLVIFGGIVGFITKYGRLKRMLRNGAICASIFIVWVLGAFFISMGELDWVDFPPAALKAAELGLILGGITGILTSDHAQEAYEKRTRQGG